MPEVFANPWLSSPRATPPPPPASRMPMSTGPTRPHPGLAAPDRQHQLPVVVPARAASLWLLGAHGGAGESTLASLYSSWSPAGHAWPGEVRDAARAWGPAGATRVVLLARSHAHGLRAAQRSAHQWAAGLVPHVELAGLVVVADAPGRLPKPLADLVEVIGGGVPRLWRLPWVEAWRQGEVPTRSRLPRAVRAVVDDLRAISHPDPWDGDPTFPKDPP